MTHSPTLLYASVLCCILMHYAVQTSFNWLLDSLTGGGPQPPGGPPPPPRGGGGGGGATPPCSGDKTIHKKTPTKLHTESKTFVAWPCHAARVVVAPDALDTLIQYSVFLEAVACLCVCVQTLLESHQGWYHLQRCKDRFEGLLRIDKLKSNASKAVPPAAASQRSSATAAPSGEQHDAAHFPRFACCLQLY